MSCANTWFFQQVLIILSQGKPNLRSTEHLQQRYRCWRPSRVSAWLLLKDEEPYTHSWCRSWRHSWLLTACNHCCGIRDHWCTGRPRNWRQSCVLVARGCCWEMRNHAWQQLPQLATLVCVGSLWSLPRDEQPSRHSWCLKSKAYISAFPFIKIKFKVFRFTHSFQFMLNRKYEHSRTLKI